MLHERRRVGFPARSAGMPVAAEAGLVERDIRLLTELKSGRPHLHVAHLSTAAALDAVRRARRDGLHVTCEVAPHHFVLTESAVGEYNANAKMNPPLRAESDRRAMLEGLLDGSIDCIATDHAPHATHEKEQEFERAPNGITGLESALGLTLELLHRKHKVSLSRLITLLSTQPANLLNLRGRGSLAAGAFADVVIFDPEAEWILSSGRDPLQIEQHSLRRLDDAGPRENDHQRRPRSLPRR